jgi:lysozyme
LERGDLIPLGKAKLTDMVIEFCEAVSAAGYYPMFYTNLNWARNYLDMSRLKKYDLWFARYNSTISC